ncbi:hypothetical protein LCGC14_2033740 [marine sediment metagenome]|uniref:Uncharacterized protein n=1 Tax=marine sediment metagenome TaxID=412755 RepID=A0A0F9H7E3_9ZZZZ
MDVNIKDKKPDYVNVLLLPDADHLQKILVGGKEIPFVKVNEDSIAVLSVGVPLSSRHIAAFNLRFHLRFVAYEHDDYMKMADDQDHIPTPINIPSDPNVKVQ